MPEVKGLSNGVTHVKELVQVHLAKLELEMIATFQLVLITPLPVYLFQKININ